MGRDGGAGEHGSRGVLVKPKSFPEKRAHVDRRHPQDGRMLGAFDPRHLSFGQLARCRSVRPPGAKRPFGLADPVPPRPTCPSAAAFRRRGSHPNRHRPPPLTGTAASTGPYHPTPGDQPCALLQQTVGPLPEQAEDARQVFVQRPFQRAGPGRGRSTPAEQQGSVLHVQRPQSCRRPEGGPVRASATSRAWLSSNPKTAEAMSSSS